VPGVAGRLPFRDKSFDAALVVLADQHYRCRWMAVGINVGSAKSDGESGEGDHAVCARS